jgi:hypothetical protein
MAWALSQIFVIDRSPIYRKKSGKEHFLNYFDIFVRNAFGNYRDILKEVSYSPMMGYMLTYAGSKARKVTGNAPDENYAREVMQLFSMGLYKLHENGTRVTDAKGEPELAYSIDDIATLSAGWTGFTGPGARANMEDSVLMTLNTFSGVRFMNVIDPMRVKGSFRDTNPKRTPTSGYIGDGNPLCTDLPKRAFLKTGAEFRYLGSNPAYDKLKGSGLHWRAGEYTSTSGADFELYQNSALYKTLCGAASGPCTFKSVLTLSENLSCMGPECNLDEVRVVKLANAGVKENGDRYDVYYEYVRRPCVHHSFFANPTVVTSHIGLDDHPHMAVQNPHGMLWGELYRPMCVNPKTLAAQAACCPKNETGKSYRWRPLHKTMVDGKFTGWGFKVKYIDQQNVATSSCEFVNEHVTYATAAVRCEAKGQEVCDFTALSDPTGSTTVCEKKLNQFWRPGQCTVNAQITLEGQVSIIDDIPHMVNHTHPEGSEFDSDDTFRVVWANGNFPVAETGCGGGACTVRGKTCVCSTTLSNDAVFAALPSSRNEVISKLTVGAVDPTTLDTDTYTVGATNSEVTVYFLKSNPGFTTDAIVKVGDGSKSSKPLYFKNLVSTVFMGDTSTGFSFINPVSFHSKYEVGSIQACKSIQLYTILTTALSPFALGTQSAHHSRRRT